MRTTLLTLLRDLTREVPFPEPIYEFGAQRVPGQQHLPRVRDFFPGRRFVGCDIHPGPGVDEIHDLHAVSIPDASVGTVLMFDTIEHVRDPWIAMAEVRRILKPGGLLLMTSVWYFPIHAYPDDYWRFTTSGFRTLFHDLEPVSLTMCGLARLPHTVVGIAAKPPIDSSVASRIDGVVAGWRQHGSRSWKELVLEYTPPALLIPAYDRFLRLLNAINRIRGRE